MSGSARADVLLLGTFHMANPGRDVINVVVDDVLAPHRQQELEEIAERLARFSPTKVCVEQLPSRQDALDAAYGRWAEGKGEPDRGEDVQVGFRVARRCGLSRVYGIDAPALMEWEPLQAYLERDADAKRLFDRHTADQQEEARALSERLPRTPLRQALLEMNTEESYRRDHSFYVDFGGIGPVGEHAGAAMTASWYARNIRIFSNLCGLTEPEDRIFVVYGGGHVPILRHLVRHSSRHRLVEAEAFLR